MNATEYFKKHGYKKCKEVCAQNGWLNTGFWIQLKRIIECHELVEIHGFEKSKEIVANAPSDEHFYSWTLGGSGVRDKTVNIGELRKVITDVESCL